MTIFLRFFDDFLLLAGCICILYGVWMLNPIVFWLVAGAMLIGFGVLVGKVKAKRADN